MPYELDTETDGIITMHLPSTMLPSILDSVRNEKTDLFRSERRSCSPS